MSNTVFTTTAKIDESTATAREIIESRIGESLGPISEMSAVRRRSLSQLAKALIVARRENAKRD
jgi:hypothetical protein